MAERTDHLKTEPDPDELAEHIAATRGRLDALVSQLDERRHVVSRAKTSIESNPLRAAAIAAAVVAVGVAVVSLTARRRRRLHLSTRTRRLAHGFSRLLANPENVASKDPTAAGKVLTAAATAIAATLGRRLTERLVSPRRA
jgi:hypothetical protein